MWTETKTQNTKHKKWRCQMRSKHNQPQPDEEKHNQRVQLESDVNYQQQQHPSDEHERKINDSSQNEPKTPATSVWRTETQK